MCTAVIRQTYLDCFYPGLLCPGLGLGRDRGITRWEREGGEAKSAVNDYRCKMAVCWTEFYPGTWVWETLTERNGWVEAWMGEEGAQ